MKRFWWKDSLRKIFQCLKFRQFNLGHVKWQILNLGEMMVNTAWIWLDWKLHQWDRNSTMNELKLKWIRFSIVYAEHVHWPQMTKRLSKSGLTSSWGFFLRYFVIAWLTLNWVSGWKAFSQTRDSSRAGYYATISWTYQIKEINYSKFQISL